MELRGKTVIVTGASEGIGRETARLFAAAGARVVAAARNAERLDSLAKEIERDGGEAIAVPTDVRDDAAVEAMVRTAVERFGGIDILVNNAGYGMFGPLAETPLDEVRALFEVNVFGALRCARAVVPEMRRRGGGAIVNVSSVVGKLTIPYMGAYCATKHALNSMSEALRAELREDGINVITVMPGRIDTSFGENAVRYGYGPVGAYAGAPPAQVARAIVGAVRGESRSIVVPWWNRVFPMARWVAADAVDSVVARAMRSKRTPQ